RNSSRASCTRAAVRRRSRADCRARSARAGAKTRALRRTRLVVDLARSVQDLTRDGARAGEKIDRGLAESLPKRAHRAEFQESARVVDRDDSLRAMHRQTRKHGHAGVVQEISERERL